MKPGSMLSTKRSNQPSDLSQVASSKRDLLTGRSGRQKDCENVFEGSSVFSIRDKIFALEKRLVEMGVQIPGKQYD